MMYATSTQLFLRISSGPYIAWKDSCGMMVQFFKQSDKGALNVSCTFLGLPEVMDTSVWVDVGC